MIEKQGAERLRAAGLRVTKPRITVLEALDAHPHSDALTISAAARIARYETRVGDNHHHVVCRRCGVTADVDCAAGHAPCLETLVALPSSQANGFVIDEAEVVFWGLCHQCAR